MVLAAVAMWLLGRGSDVDISGEKHGIEGPATAPSAASMP